MRLLSLLLLVPLLSCDRDWDDDGGEECFLEVLNCDDETWLLFLDGDNAGTLAPGSDIETLPGLERLESCGEDEYSGASHNLDIRTNANQPGAATTFRYDFCSSVVVAGGELHVDCEHFYCSYWAD